MLNHLLFIFRGKDKFEILRLREQQLNKKIKALINAKADICNKQINNSPIKTCIIAIIGYTNAGKTSLIKKFYFSFTKKKIIKIILLFFD